MGPKRFSSQNFSLFIVKFQKLDFSTPLSEQIYIYLLVRIRFVSWLNHFVAL